MANPEVVLEFCRTCRLPTRHEVVHSESREHVRQYMATSGESVGETSDVEITSHQEALVCLGCRTLAARNRDDGPWEGEFELLTRGPTERQMDLDFVILPEPIQGVYRETLAAVSGDLRHLCGVGLRMLIEGTCKHLGVGGKDLYQKIDALAAEGHMTADQAKQLHLLRDQGNEVVHSLDRPTREELELSLDIVEHVLTSVFILEVKANRHQAARLKRKP